MVGTGVLLKRTEAEIGRVEHAKPGTGDVNALTPS